MTPSRRRAVLFGALALFAAGFAWAYWLSLVPRPIRITTTES